MSEKEQLEQEEIFSQVLRAGRRTYFFDVRATKADDYYLTITESKKFTHDDGSFHYKKHKIYLYKEDFSEFNQMLKAATDFIIEEKVMVELKAIIQLEDVHLAQGLNYLTAYNLEKGLLINFGSTSLQVKRLYKKH